MPENEPIDGDMWLNGDPVRTQAAALSGLMGMVAAAATWWICGAISRTAFNNTTATYVPPTE